MVDEQIKDSLHSAQLDRTVGALDLVDEERERVECKLAVQQTAESETRETELAHRSVLGSDGRCNKLWNETVEGRVLLQSTYDPFQHSPNDGQASMLDGERVVGRRRCLLAPDGLSRLLASKRGAIDTHGVIHLGLVKVIGIVFDAKVQHDLDNDAHEVLLGGQFEQHIEACWHEVLGQLDVRDHFSNETEHLVAAGLVAIVGSKTNAEQL